MTYLFKKNCFVFTVLKRLKFDEFSSVSNYSFFIFLTLVVSYRPCSFINNVVVFLQKNVLKAHEYVYSM